MCYSTVGRKVVCSQVETTRGMMFWRSSDVLTALNSIPCGKKISSVSGHQLWIVLQYACTRRKTSANIQTSSNPCSTIRHTYILPQLGGQVHTFEPLKSLRHLRKMHSPSPPPPPSPPPECTAQSSHTVPDKTGT